MRRRAAPVPLSALALALSTWDARAQTGDWFALRFEGGVGSMLSDFHRIDRGFGVAWQGGARLAFTLAEPVALQLGVSNWAFSSNTGGTGWAFTPVGGLRIEPRIGSAGRFWLDAHGGAGLTGGPTRFAFDVGMGFEFQPTPIFAFGPMVRYGQMIEPDGEGAGAALRDDARYFSAGITLAVRLPPARAARARPPEQGAPAPTLIPPPPPDGDGDGVSDRDDLCPSRPPGERPDAQRRGCPTLDSDFDTVLDPDDRCVTVPQGPHPDPLRPGCPAADDDGDGVLNDADQCPAQRAGPHPDGTRPGCPDGDRDDDGVRDGDDRCIDQPETYNGVQDDDGCPESDAPSAVELDPRSHVVTLRGTVSFITGSATIVGRASFELLDGLANLLMQHAEVELVEVQGHTDARGDRAANVALSQRRAQTVVDYLTSRGVAPSRMRATGYGPDRPIDPRAAPAAWTVNRRTEVRVLRWAQP